MAASSPEEIDAVPSLNTGLGLSSNPETAGVGCPFVPLSPTGLGSLVGLSWFALARFDSTIALRSAGFALVTSFRFSPPTSLRLVARCLKL